jgi:hypothetical protein
MRLPIEDDWKPQVGDNTLGERDYEEHVKMLARRLHDANKVAGEHSKVSHDTAMRYYDRQTKLMPFKKGDLVYLHDPVYKRAIAKKFSYQYKGPYEIEQKISPLIYKIRLTDGTSTIVHINRLKGASDQAVESKVHPLSRSSKVVKPPKPQKRELVSGVGQQDLRVSHHAVGSSIDSQVENSSSSDENEIKLAHESTADPDWTPGAYINRK